VSLSRSAQDGAQALGTASLDAMDAQDDVPVASAKLPASPPGHVGEGGKDSIDSTQNDFRSSPPAPTHEAAMDLDLPNAPPDESLEDAAVKSDSEAETIVLPGKDGHSPSKIRKSIKHEDKSDDEEIGDAPDIGSENASGGNAGEAVNMQEYSQGTEGDRHKSSGTSIATSMLGKRKRLKHGAGQEDDNGSNKVDSAPGNSSGLSSVPTSPVATTRSSLSKPGASDSDISRSPSPRWAVRDKAKSVDRVLPRRKQYASGSGDEGDDDVRSFNRQRSSGADHRSNKDRRTSLKSNAENTAQKRTRSVSPHSRGHRRSTSTQLPSKSTHGLSHKKKRVPAPLQSTEYQSDESSASGSSHPRSSRLRHLAAPTTGDSTISPAKMAPHKKHVNSSGQTLVARACASGKLDIVKQRLEERPEDLDEADHAKNTPLHAASIAGHVDIVKLLLDSGCIVDPVNLARDTPLHDAIDNGHLECVKLLLSAGANPRKANGKGEDPSDLVDDEDDFAAEMREAINAAKQKTSDVRRSSEDDQMHDNADSRLSYPKGSPRYTPPAQAHDALAIGHTSRRNATTRSIKTSDRELYQPLNLNELRRAAGSNDIRTVVRILDVFNNDLDDPKSLIIAAKAGYDEVINMLFGFSVTNPDPEPLDDMPPESATPILAAIGRESLKVIELFLNQPAFNPTRLVNGETYYEIAKSRGGTLWKEEEELLRDAFNKYNKTHPSSPSKPRSPGLRRDGRETNREAKPPRRDIQPASRSNTRTVESESIKSQHRSSSSANHSKDGPVSAKRGPGRPRKEEHTSSTMILDDEAAPLGPPKQKNQARRSEYDAAVASSESETAVKPRRKLVSGKEFRGERELEKQRRASVASNASGSSIKEKREAETNADKLARKSSPSVPRISKGLSNNEQESTSEKHPEKEKPRSVKRDDSKDRLTAIRGESPVKRPWKSETPPRSSMQEVTAGYEASGGPQKKRKLEGDANPKPGSKAERAASSSPDSRTSNGRTDIAGEKSTARSNSDAKDREKSNRSAHKRVNSPEASRQSHSNDEASKGQTTTISDSASKDSNVIGEETSQDGPAEQPPSPATKAADEQGAQALREKEELEAKQKAELENKLELERVEQARQARLAREEATREEELKRQQEENERKERQRQEDLEAHAREQERQRALYLEQEKQRQKDLERRRAQIQEQQRAERARIEEQKNKERLSKLPLLLRWLDGAKDPKTPEVAVLFRIIEGFRFDTIKPEATGQPNGREQWMLNTHAAVLLGEKDIQLSRCKSMEFICSSCLLIFLDTAWERIPLSPATKQAVWRIQNGVYSLYDPSLTCLRKQLPEQLPDNGQPARKVIETCKALFLTLDLFFVKVCSDYLRCYHCSNKHQVSEFMFVVPNFPHLRNLEMIVKYRELSVDPTPPPRGKWRDDPDTDPNQKFAPQPNHFMNGEFIRQREAPHTKTSATSFGERRVPRRGLVQVFPGESDYYTIAREQGLYHLLPQECPNAADQNGGPEHVNGITPPSSEKSKSINGVSPSRGSLSEAEGPSNGVPVTV
jgi:hypothetical protein